MGVLLAVAVLVGLDMVYDAGEGSSWLHLVLEGLAVAVAGGAALVLWRRLQGGKRVLERDLASARAEAERWRSEAGQALAGLGEAIDRQCDHWQLTPAEREVALLLLKGLSMKEVAAARETSERTVRQQALTVYKKSGLAGRAELAAFFLEDLLLPRKQLTK